VLETSEIADVAADSETLWTDITRVCNRIPPLWDLHNYVAVNPFLGFTAEPIDQTAQTIGAGLGAQLLPDLTFFRQRWNEEAFGPTDLAGAARRLGHDPHWLEAILAGHCPMPMRTSHPVRTFAELHDRDYGTDWNNVLNRSVGRWCAVHVLGGGTYWGLPTSQCLYESWLGSARVDRSLEIAGLRGWRAWVTQLPAHPEEAIRTMLTRLKVPGEKRTAYLYRLLGGLYGWASYLRRAAWEKGSGEPGAVADLLAIRICGDAAVVELLRPAARTKLRTVAEEVEDESIRLAFQEALEDGFARKLLNKLVAAPRQVARVRPAVQAVFCIDVRSEPLRRHLEAQALEIETLGFAGFFGIALDWQVNGCGSARCPVLVRPDVHLKPMSPIHPRPLASGALKHIQSAPAASFSFVELLGLAYGIRLAADSLAVVPDPEPADHRVSFQLERDDQDGGFDRERRVDLAAAILKNMGLRDRLARLVLLCGHESRSANNPHAASLDCGACGGHGGAINARIAAALLNDPAVRAGLTSRGWNLPADTHFLAAVHNTSTDEVTLLDWAQAPDSHQPDIARLRSWLDEASAQVRRERASSLGLNSSSVSVLDRLLRRRARDWSEVRPEWGLARNAAFIVARRVRTRGVDLEGRAFLHEYDAAVDTDNSVLHMVLSGPMVVGAWINLQYFASTVDNRVFGCGTKALHNRVGAVGVVLGNGGDLRTGLAVQSVHAADGRWFHEPLRLQVIVEAPPERIEQVLASQPEVKQLVENGWVRLFALGRDRAEVYQRTHGFGWQRVPCVE
jgi:uncharacterized protein YbcC (UPF0753/DUF2309 family)